MSITTLIFVFIYLCMKNALGYPNRSGQECCKSEMIPGHSSNSPQAGQPPYAVRVHNDFKDVGEVAVTVMIRMNNANVNHFKGFKLLAVDHMGYIIGTWRLLPESDQIAITQNCLSENDSGSHNSPYPKQNATLVWRAPPKYTGQVQFRATVVYQFNVFWSAISTRYYPVDISQYPFKNKVKEDQITKKRISN